jgi:hypothetical protein
MAAQRRVVGLDAGDRYAEHFPERVSEIVLSTITTSRRSEAD